MAPDSAVRARPLTPKARQMAALIRRDETDGVWRCWYCRVEVAQLDTAEPIDWTKPYPEWDHVTPRSRGGSGRRGNAVVACQGCNVRKGNRLLTELPAGWTNWRRA